MSSPYPALQPDVIPRATLSTYTSKQQFSDWRSQLLISVLKLGGVPSHIGFIMDGNRRFARQHNLAIKSGHEGGFLGLRRVLEFCLRLHVRTVSVYAFSIENFNRGDDEVEYLMGLASEKLAEIAQHGDIVQQHNVRIAVLGATHLLRADVRAKLVEIETRTQHNDGATLNICMPYTSRDEMSTAMLHSGGDRRAFDAHLMTHHSPPLDILVRSSAVNRFSDFLMFQASLHNTHVQVVDAFWPDIGIAELVPVLLNWQRKRWSASLAAGAS